MSELAKAVKNANFLTSGLQAASKAVAPHMNDLRAGASLMGEQAGNLRNAVQTAAKPVGQAASELGGAIRETAGVAGQAARSAGSSLAQTGGQALDAARTGVGNAAQWAMANPGTAVAGAAGIGALGAGGLYAANQMGQQQQPQVRTASARFPQGSAKAVAKSQLSGDQARRFALTYLGTTGGVGALLGGGAAGVASDWDPKATASGAVGGGLVAPVAMLPSMLAGVRAGGAGEDFLKTKLPKVFSKTQRFNRNPAANRYSGPGLVFPGGVLGAAAPSTLAGAGLGHALRPAPESEEKSASYHLGCLTAISRLSLPNEIY